MCYKISTYMLCRMFYCWPNVWQNSVHDFWFKIRRLWWMNKSSAGRHMLNIKKKKWRLNFRMWNPEFIVISCRSTILNIFGPRCCKCWKPVCILCQFFSFVKRKCLNYSKFELTFEKFIYIFLKLYELYSCKLNIMLKGFLENIIGKKN